MNNGSSKSSDWSFNFLSCSLIAILALVVFSRAFGSDFVFDSGFIIPRDPRVTQFGADSIHKILTENYWWASSTSSLYRPVTTAAFFIQYNIFGFGDKPAGYQLVNLGLHALNAMLGLLLLRRLGVSPGLALFAALWFLMHPYATEVVPNVVGLSDLLSLLSLLVGTHIYLRMIDERISLTRGALALSAVGCLGVFAKESAVSLLAVIIWHALTLGRSRASTWLKNSGSRRWLLIIPLVLILAAALLPKAFFKDEKLDFDTVAVDNPLRDVGFIESRVNALAILADNFLNCLVPTSISADYSYPQLHLTPIPPRSPEDWRLVTFAALIVLLGALGLFWYRRRPALSFAIGAYFAAALPTANLILLIGTIRADRLVYQTILPAVVVTGLLLFQLLGSVQVLKKLGERIPPRLYPWGCAILLLPLAALSNLRCVDWRTTKGFWEATYATSPDSFKSKGGLASSALPITLAECDRNVELTRESWLQIKNSGSKNIMANKGADEALARALLDRAAYYINNPGSGDPMPDMLAAKDLWSALVDRKHYLSRVFLSKEGFGKGRRLKFDEEIIALAEIERYTKRPEKAVALLRENAEAGEYSAGYLRAYGRALIDAGDVAGGVLQLCKALILKPDDENLARETQFIWDHKKLPESALPFSSQKIPPHLPVLNINDKELYEIANVALRELANQLQADEMPEDRQAILRFARVKLALRFQNCEIQ